MHRSRVGRMGPNLQIIFFKKKKSFFLSINCQRNILLSQLVPYQTIIDSNIYITYENLIKKTEERCFFIEKNIEFIESFRSSRGNWLEVFLGEGGPLLLAGVVLAGL